MLNQQTYADYIQRLLATAASALRMGDPAKAVSIYREMLQVDRENPDLVFSLAIAEHQLGRFTEARTILLAAARMFPRDARFPMLAGRTFKALGKLDEAVTWYRRALEINPEYLDAMVGLGVALWRTRAFDEGVDLLTKARQMQPQSFEVIANLGNALFEAGRHEEALNIYEESLALKPDSPEAHNNLGRALLAIGRKDEAAACFERAVGIAPNHAEALYNLGTLRLADGDVDGAAQHLAKAVHQNATYIDGYIALAKVLFDVGAFLEALKYLDAVVRIRPEDPEGYVWRGLVLREQGDIPAALECFARVAELKPESPDGYALLGSTYWIMGEHAKAAEAGNAALQRNDKYPPVLNLQGNLSILTGRVKEALGWYGKAVNADPEYADAYDNLLFVSNYHDEAGARQLFELHRQWGTKVIRFPSAAVAGEARQTDRKIRVGFVSPDFRNHSVAYFVEPIFSNMDRSRFELYLYSADRRMDSITKRLSDQASAWTNITAIGDDPAAAIIAKDRIDILVDLAGHTSGNRLGVFARTPAPIQITYLGYPTTTGLPTMQYRLTDWTVDPNDEQNLNTERPLRLPASYFCYGPAADAPDVGPLPAATSGRITFGSFNNLAKISPTAIQLWAQVLKAVPFSRLLLKNRGVSGESVQREMIERFQAAGIESARLAFAGWESSTESHLALYGRVDIALDTYPYNGATTTCEALWMGIPVITLRGTTHASRMGASILAAAGHPEFVARSEAEFVALASGQARDFDALARQRSNLREEVEGSPLMAHAKFTRDFENLLAGLMSSHNAD